MKGKLSEKCMCVYGSLVFACFLKFKPQQAGTLVTPSINTYKNNFDLQHSLFNIGYQEICDTNAYGL